MKKKEGEESKTTRVDTSKNGARLAPALDLRSKQLSFRHSLTPSRSRIRTWPTLFSPQVDVIPPCCSSLSLSRLMARLCDNFFRYDNSLPFFNIAFAHLRQVTHRYFWVRLHP
jgi:hypothetical protein